MTSFTPTQIPATGDNPGGIFRQDKGFGLGELVLSLTGDADGQIKNSQPHARTVGEAEWNDGNSGNIGVGGTPLAQPLGQLGHRNGQTVGTDARTGRGAWLRVTPHTLSGV